MPQSALTVPESPIALVGTVALLVAYVVAAWCVAAGIAGNARRDRRLVQSSVYGLYGFFALVGLASAMIIYGFLTHDYAIKYVAMTSDTSMSTAYKITAFWGGLDGSLLFWVLVLGGFSTVAVRVNSERHRDMIGYVVATIMVVQLFFLSVLIYSKNPFATYLTEPPMDGQGLNPLLQNYWMVIHPPSLYIGFVAATIPFAFGIGALASGRLEGVWLSSVRSWMLICFFFLSLGLILGGRWAYEELGWGGYWAWDPVENAGMIPWFTAVAFLHSAIIQEQRGMLRVWNLWLVILTFFLTIFGTFMTRSGIVQSVHAFGKDDALALQFVLFMAFILVISVGLLLFRHHKLRSTNSFESFVSREFSFLLNNWILLACAAFVLFVTMFPTISEAIQGERVAIGIGFYNRMMTPLGLLLLLLAGIAPLLAWRRTTRERLYAQFMFPLIAMVLVIAVVAISFPEARTLTALAHKKIKLPMALIDFGVVAFVFASIAQEFWRGVSVRRKQTGSDPITSLIGLVLTKRRKYGGYIVHLGMAVMFLGFAGKAYETMTDRTIDVSRNHIVNETLPALAKARGPDAAAVDKAALARDIDRLVLSNGGYQSPLLSPDEASAVLAKAKGVRFQVHGYDFIFEDLVQTSDDNKLATTAYVSVWLDGERLTTLEPAKWEFRKGGQETTEVAIHPRITEDVYIVLTGFNPETGLGNFRIYINPLINWVWLGFVLLTFGTFICLIPQKVVELVSPRPKSRIGRIADVAVLIAVVLGVTFGAVHVARAEAPPGAPTAPRAPRVAQAGPPAGMEHVEQGRAARGHEDGEGFAHLYRPNSPTASALMKELICLCGGCQRETLFDCKCAFAADERQRVLQLLAGLDTKSEAGSKQAYDTVVAAFVQQYGGRHVLATPRSSIAWALPYLAVAGGLALLLVVGRSWVRRGREAEAAASATRPVEDAEDAEKLDDELRETD